MRAALGTVALLAAGVLAASGCTADSCAGGCDGPDVEQTRAVPSTSGGLTDDQLSLAVDAARTELRGQRAEVTSATVSLERNGVSQPNTGQRCASGRVLEIRLLGTFPHIVTTGMPVLDGDRRKDFTVHGVLLTADSESGAVCLIGVQTGKLSPDRDATPIDVG